MITLLTSTTLAALAASTSLGLIATIGLIVTLAKHELVNGLDDLRAVRLSDALRIAIAPLLLVFAVIVFFRIADMLR